jgi:hypothetical protein
MATLDPRQSEFVEFYNALLSTGSLRVYYPVGLDLSGNNDNGSVIQDAIDRGRYSLILFGLVACRLWARGECN